VQSRGDWAVASPAFRELWRHPISGLAQLLSHIPSDWVQVASLCLGALILVVLVLGHGAGLFYIVRLTVRAEQHLLLRQASAFKAILLFCTIVFLMLTLHIAEVLIWAGALVQLGLITAAHDAIYFGANAYTTLGYGSVPLEKQWRDIAPIIAISGLFTFAWTTSTLVDVVRHQRELIALLETKRAQKKAHRAKRTALAEQQP